MDFMFCKLLIIKVAKVLKLPQSSLFFTILKHTKLQNSQQKKFQTIQNLQSVA